MERRSLDLITMYVVALAAIASCGAWLAAGNAVGVGAVTGAALSVVNWLGLRWILRKALATQNKGGLMALLMLKMIAMFTVIGVLVVRAMVSPVGLGIGVSALVVGLFLGALHARGAVTAAGEEP